MKKIILCILTIYNFANAQVTPEWIARTYWGSSSGTLAYTMALDDSLNLYVTGCGGGPYGTVKYNSSGIEVWRKTYSGSNMTYMTALAIALDETANVYITGLSYALGSINSTVTVKYNTAGTEQWARKFDANPSSIIDELGSAISVDKSGNVLVTGLSYSNLLNRGKENNIYYTIKYTPQGDSIWVIRIPSPAFGGFGNSPSMILDSLDNIYTTLVADSANNNDFKLYTSKYDSSGNLIWKSGYEITPAGSFNINNFESNGFKQYFNHITIDRSLNVYISINDNGVSTLKYDSDGKLQWAANSISAQYPIGIEVDDHGNVYGAAEINLSPPRYEDYFTFKLNRNGGLLWSNNFNGLRNLYEHPYSMTLDKSGNVYVTGRAYMAQDSTPDYCTIKYDSSGNLRGVASYDGPGHSYDRAYKVITDKYNNIYVTGGSESISTFDYTTIKYSTLTNFQSTIPEIPKKYFLSQNYPNPFNPVTVISYQLALSNDVSLKVYNALGSEVATLINEKQNEGRYSVEFNGAGLPSGIYFYKLETKDFSEVKKMILIK